jgi:signal transduction histidine kinase
VAIASLVALAFLVPLALLVQQLAHERALAQAERQTAIVMSVLAVTTDPNAVKQVIASTHDEESGQLAVHGLTAAPVGNSHAPAQYIATAAGQRRTVVEPVPGGGLAYLEPIEVDDDRVAVVEVHIPDEALTGGVRGAWLALAGVAVGLVVGAALVGDRLAVRLVGPARSLAGAATALGDGNLDVRVQPSGSRELAEAGAAFNHMADRLAALRTAEREMVADLSHRLRTPLTGLRLDVEALEAAAGTWEHPPELRPADPVTGEPPAPPWDTADPPWAAPDPPWAAADPGLGTADPDSDPADPDWDPADPDWDPPADPGLGTADPGWDGADPSWEGPDPPPWDTDAHRTIGRVRQALAALEHEVDMLIRTTRQAAAAVAAEPAPPGRCDASEAVAERMVFWSAVAGDQDRPCRVSGTHLPAPVGVPASELGAALDAVLGNAFRYTPQGTALEVAVTRHDGWVAVRVDDAGPGIPDPDRALRRGASDRGSTGLGLDIARRVAQAGGGSVSVGTGQLGGASVVMLFADIDAPPPEQPSRLGLIGRLTREPRIRQPRTREARAQEPGKRPRPRAGRARDHVRSRRGHRQQPPTD